jgi:hypothetical protein
MEERLHFGTESVTPRRRRSATRRDTEVEEGRAATQDVTDDFQVGTRVDLPASVRTSKCMCADHLLRIGRSTFK